MFKEWLKQFLAVVLCIITLVCCMPTSVYADTPYVKDSSEDGFTYYIIQGKDVKKLFDFSLKDALSGYKAVNWLFTFRSFTVIKEYDDEGSTEYKVYFNTPNLQSIVKNAVISTINDGYTDHTYDVNETEWMVDVGQDATSENVITKYGFAIPNYTYMGEYPKEVMTVAGIVPTSFWEGVWRTILSIFGVSFIDAPDASNYNTIEYLNHQYHDENDLLLELFKNYYMKYFVRKINTAEFATPEDLIEASVTKEESEAAKAYTKAHENEYKEIKGKYDVFTNMTDSEGNMTTSTYKQLNTTLVANKLSTSTKVNGQSMEQWLTDTSSETHRTNRLAEQIRQWITSNSSYQANATISMLAQAFYPNTTFNTSNNADIVKMWYGASSVQHNSSAASRIKIKNGKNETSLSTFLSYYGNSSYTVKNKNYADDKKLKNNKYTLVQIYGSNPTLQYGSYSISLNNYIHFINNFALFDGFTGFELGDFLTEDEKLLYELYNKNKKIQENYTKFKGSFGKDEKPVSLNNDIIGYSQCLIKSEESKKCETKAADGKTSTSISVASLYAYSGLYKITKDAGDTLTTKQAIQVINKLKTYCGPYYDEVLGNMITIMLTIAAKNGDDSILKAVMDDDPRVMPFDVDQLPETDRANYEVSDPRVRLYKSHIIGKLVSNFELSFGFGIFIKPQTILISLGGKIAEVAVMLQQLCNFDKLDELGLSPTYMWQSAFTTLLMMLLALFFIIKTVIAIIKMGTKSGARLVIAFILLVFELGIVTAFAVNPEGMWTNIKSIETNIISLGERTSTLANSPNTAYLFGDATDGEVIYYLPYLDLWSKYNTGHGLQDTAQLMNNATDKAELKDYNADAIKIGSGNVKHYSVLLADSFSYFGASESVSNSVEVGGEICNGTVINNNAYRVVDHFMAPRVNVNKSGSNITLDLVDNENYNEEFQSGFINLISKFLNCLLLCLISIIKFFTFLWQWFLLYILIFKIILGKSAEGKSFGLILLETFAPTLALIFIGVYAGIIVQLGMILEGLLGIIMEVFLFWLTFAIIRWWKGLKYGLFFPNTLQWLYILTSLNQHKRRRYAEDLSKQSNNDAKDVGIEFTEEELHNVHNQTDRLFNDDGTFKAEYNNSRNKKVYENWYNYAINSRNMGIELSNKDKAAMHQFESDDRYRDYADTVNKRGVGRKFNKKIRRQNNNSADSSNNNLPNNKSTEHSNDTTANNSNSQSGASDEDQFKWSRRS